MANEKKKGAKQILPIIFGVILIAGAVYGATKYIYSLHHAVTDDAQIDGDITPVTARASGYINEIRFRENDHVKEGDTLVKIDDRDLRLKVEQAEAALQNAVANVDVMKSNVGTTSATVKAAESNVDQAKAKAWKANEDYKRYEKLLSDKSITQSQFDNAKAEKMSADAALDASERQLEATKGQVGSASDQISVSEAQVKARQADLDFAKLQLSYTIITAPAAGIASKKNIQLGQLVQVGQVLFAIVSDSNNYLVANFKETQLEKMQVGQKVDVTVDAFPDEEMEGTVYSFSGATGARFSLLPPDNATGNFVKVIQRVPVKVVLNVPKDLAPKLRPGMSAKVAVHLE